MKNPYLMQINKMLPRLLALYDRDQNSPTYGIGDRFYWSWKLIDFGNGTFQGAVNGLARLQKYNLLPEWLSTKEVDNLIESMFLGAEKLRRKNGSMEEAFPFEASFCVTALVAYDLLVSLELQQDRLSEAEINTRLKIVAPMILFLYKNDEKHAIISNHLATAVGALFKWHRFTGEEKAEKRGIELLEIIKDNFSDEGWFTEYEGADPGYQTLCMYYLTEVHSFRPDLNLEDMLQKSIEFLAHFAHPDGSYGGNYGSRNTRFYYPAAFEYFNSYDSMALSAFMRESISNLKTVTLEVMDEPNLIPMFNCYALAAVLYKEKESLGTNHQQWFLPCSNSEEQNINYTKAGLHIRGNKTSYTIISSKKGGVVYSFDRSGLKKYIDCGAITHFKGKTYSTQVNKNANLIINDFNRLIIETYPTEILYRLPSSIEFVLLRILNLTIMRHVALGNVIKRILVQLLITKHNALALPIQREIIMRHKDLATVKSKWSKKGKEKYGEVKNGGKFKSIHMASAGYWQRGEDL